MEKKYELVRKAYDNAYAQYSHFKVGAVLVMKNGEYILGSNIENASYGLSNCAERSALFQAFSLGYRQDDILELVVIGDTARPISPCGACRQVMMELMNPTTKVTLTNLKGDKLELTVEDLLPYSFKDEDMNHE